MYKVFIQNTETGETHVDEVYEVNKETGSLFFMGGHPANKDGQSKCKLVFVSSPSRVANSLVQANAELATQIRDALDVMLVDDDDDQDTDFHDALLGIMKTLKQKVDEL